MKIITTGDWHLGNLFHGNDRLSEHKHFLAWLLAQLEERKPDALLVAGDVFDNGNPSAAAQSAYYDFLADATQACPEMQIVIIAGNHDSASRLEAPRPLLARHKVEIRGTIRRIWKQNGKEAGWVNDYDDLMIPVKGKDGEEAVILAVPYLRSDIVQNPNYSQGVSHFLKELTLRARTRYPEKKLIMMAHMYAQGAEIVRTDASEKIVIGGLEEVDLDGWTDHPDYMTCGHIHKRQHIRHTDWARYSGSILPMSFAETDYRHGVDMVTVSNGKRPEVEFIEYTPQHKLRTLPQDNEELTPKKLEKLIHKKLRERNEDGILSDNFDYVVLKVKIDKVNNDDIKRLESLVNTKDAVLCKIQKLMPNIELSTITGTQEITSIEDILDRNPLETIREAFAVRHDKDLSEHQTAMLKELIDSMTNETKD